MNKLDRKAIEAFDPQKGIYLVMSGKGDNRHIEARELKALKIPILGYILKKIGYPSFRFRSVVDYILTNGNSLEKLKDDKKAIIQDRIKHYFGLDDKNQAQRHLKQWGKVSQCYINLFPIEKIIIQNQVRPNREIDIFYQHASESKYQDIFKLKDTTLAALPPQEKYILTTTFENGRANGYSGLGDLDGGLLEDIKLHLEKQKLDRPPVILILVFPGSGFIEKLNQDNLAALEKLKKIGLIRGYCALHSDYPLGAGRYPYGNIDKHNLPAIDQLKSSLAD